MGWKDDFTKSERQQLRALMGACYEAESKLALVGLAEHFDAWRSGETASIELMEAIHDFHRDEMRELWARYDAREPVFVVIRGLNLGLIKEASVSPALLAKLTTRR